MNMSPASVAQYDSVWRGFESWARARGYTALPAKPQAIIDYLVFRCVRSYAPGTLGQDSAAIAYIHRLQGHSSFRGLHGENCAQGSAPSCRRAEWRTIVTVAVMTMVGLLMITMRDKKTSTPRKLWLQAASWSDRCSRSCMRFTFTRSYRTRRRRNRVQSMLAHVSVFLAMLTASGCEEALGGRGDTDVHCVMSYGISGETLSPPEWLRGTWRQSNREIATSPVTVSWEFTDDNAAYYLHSSTVEQRNSLKELRDRLDRDRISLQEYYNSIDTILEEILRRRDPVLDFKNLGYPVIGENSSADEYSIRQCTPVLEGKESKSTYSFVRTSSARLNYNYYGVSLSSVQLVRG